MLEWTMSVRADCHPFHTGSATPLLGLLLLALLGAPLPSPAQELPRAVADHHVHIRSAAMTEALLRVQEAVGQNIFEDDIQPLGADDALVALNAAGVERAAVLSVAYMYGIPDVDFEDERARVREENDYVAREVGRHPERLAGFFSVNPLAGYALDEMERAAALPGMVGLKLHLANSAVDLRDPEHVERLAEVFGKAEELGVPVLIHMRTRHPEYGSEDAQTFIRDVLSTTSEVPVQIAHMAGWGGYDEATGAALGAFIDAFETGALDRERFFFDLAAVVAPVSRAAAGEGMVPEVRSQHDRLAEGIRELGTDRVVFGTDWDAIDLSSYIATVALVLPLTPGEIGDIYDNVAPYVR